MLCRLFTSLISTVVFAFSLLFSCERTRTLCEGSDCRIVIESGIFIRIDDGSWPYWHRFDGYRLHRLDGMYPGSVPIAYQPKLDILAAKSLSGDGMRLTLYRGGDGTLDHIRTRNFATDEILSLCLNGEGSLWMLHAGKPEGTGARQFILSGGSIALEEWRNYFLTSERESDTFGGTVIEKPISLSCSEKGPFLVTFLYSGEGERRLLRLPRFTLLQIYLYRFDEKKQIMELVAAVTPRGNGMVSPWVEPQSGRLLVFQGGRLTVQEGFLFPEMVDLPGVTEVLFGAGKRGTSLYLIKGEPQRITGAPTPLPTLQ